MGGFKVCESFLPFLLTICCTIATIIMFSKCLMTYLRDEDTSQVEYKRFHKDNESIYPSVSICFKRPFLKNILKEHTNPPVDVKNYSKFIAGKQWSDQLANIEYDNVTLDLMDYLRKVKLTLSVSRKTFIWDVENRNLVREREEDGMKNESRNKEFSHHDVSPPAIYVSNRGSEEWLGKGKCYTVDMPFIPNRPIHSLKLDINGSIFPDGIRPKNMEFSTWLSYPHQFLRSVSSQTLWESKVNQSEFYLRNIEIGFQQVLKRRNKPSKACIEGWYDDTIYERSILKIGCIPAYWPIQLDLPKCKRPEEYQNIVDELDWTKHDNPCIAIEKVYDSFDEDDQSAWVPSGKWPDKKGLLQLRFIFPDKRFVEVMYTKEYSFESFVGNAGGYLGLFLGSGALQLASTLLDYLTRMIKRTITRKIHC
jgi:hypothetical protein